MSHAAKTLLSGFIFGSVLIHANLHTISVYTDIPALLTIYATALVISGVVICFARKAGMKLPSRKESGYGYFAYDGNVIGGFMQGVCMVLLRGEPGSMLVRMGMGMPGSVWNVLGGVVGGVLFVVGSPLTRRTGRMGGLIHDWAAGVVCTLSGFAVLVLVLVLVFMWRDGVGVKRGLDVSSVDGRLVRGGIGIGLSQLASLALTGGTLGVSSVYPALATRFIRWFDTERTNPGCDSLVFALGVVLGGYVFRLCWGGDLVSGMELDNTTAFFAGALLVIGARVAGGCTSGHGISGCGLLSLSSYITVASMIVGMISTSLLT